MAAYFRSPPSRMLIHVINSQYFSVNISDSVTRGIQFPSNTTGHLKLTDQTYERETEKSIRGENKNTGRNY